MYYRNEAIKNVETFVADTRTLDGKPTEWKLIIDCDTYGNGFYIRLTDGLDYMETRYPADPSFIQFLFTTLAKLNDDPHAVVGVFRNYLEIFWKRITGSGES